MTTKLLQLGMVCSKGHRLTEPEDIYEYRSKVSGSGDNARYVTRRRCRICKLALDKKNRAEYSSDLIKAGRCHRGHQILSLADVYVWGDRQRCRACYRVPKHTPLWVVHQCGHRTYFHPPVPKCGELIYCVRCQDYKEVINFERGEDFGQAVSPMADGQD